MSEILELSILNIDTSVRFLKNLSEVMISVSLTISWFLLILMSISFELRYHKALSMFSIVFCLISGPNLMIWNGLGCYYGAWEIRMLYDYLPESISQFLEWGIRGTVWIGLFSLAGVLSLVSGVLIHSWLKSLNIRNRVKRWRNTIILSKEMSQCDICSICLHNYSVYFIQVGEFIQTFPKCHHSFHKECASLWLKDHSTCPICRQEY